ncbi:MAG: hypothetical protein KR126chlam6_01231 [Candidatus Anoxychlamydiales bacterium]|nr:hypothetical protein [Candidatus Anoxychlamydiales bacterium]
MNELRAQFLSVLEAPMQNTVSVMNSLLTSVIYALEEKKQLLFIKYGEEKENKISIKQENVKTFTKDIGDLLDIEVEIEVTKVKLNDLGDIKLSPLDMLNLDILIEK